MTSERQQILEILNTPKTQVALGDKLCDISDAFLGLRDAKGAVSTATDEEWKGIHDFLLYLERAESKDSKDGVLQTDPLTAITAAEHYQAVSGDTAKTLREDFMRQVRAITGVEMKPGQIKKLFSLFSTYNPVSKMDLGKGPKP
ncbi:MAG: hypothetical protein JWO78_1155 [Micavibrio sp.]|nr:hypothetical protein [Micavibrio sp.]